MSSLKSTNRYALIMIGALFFIFGFVTWVNSILIPFLKLACELETDTQAFLVTTAFYMAYFFLAIPSAYILKATGYKNGMALGLLIMAAGSLIFLPAAETRSFGLFLTGLFVQGIGLTLLQTASNPYVSIIGPMESAAQRISIMGICNKGAGALGPAILGTILLKNAASLEGNIAAATTALQKEALLDELASRVIVPYIVITIVLLLLSLLVRKSKLPEVDVEDEAATSEATPKKSVFQFPHLLLGVLCIFLYVGVEVLAGDAIGTYGKSMGMSLDETKNFTSFTLIMMLVGYLVGIFTIPKYISQQFALRISAILGILFSVGIYFSTGYVAIVFIALLGLANALMWPAIFPLAIDGLGRFTKIGAALLIMGVAGGAVFPPVYGWLKDSMLLSNNVAFTLCTIPCYAYILYYAVIGHRAGKPVVKKVYILD